MHPSDHPQFTPNSTSGQGQASILLRDDLIGFVARAAAVTLMIALVVMTAFALRANGLWIASLSSNFLIVVGLVVWQTNMLGLFFSEYPKGNDHALLRLALATFCRTGLPLLVVFVGLDYASTPTAIGYIAVVYCVGFFGSLVLEVFRLETALPQPTGQG